MSAPEPSMSMFASTAEYWRHMAVRREAEITRLTADAERMADELRNERDPRSVVQRALIMAAFLPHNQDKTPGAMRAAAVEMFGQEALDAAMQVWRNDGGPKA